MPHDDSQQSFELPEPSPHLHDGELDGLNPDHTPFRRRRTTDVYTKIHNYLADPRTDCISPLDLLIQRQSVSQKSAKLSKLLETIIADPQGRTKLFDCMRPHVVEFACEIVAEEMEVRRKKSILSGIAAVSPDFMQNWNLEEENDTTAFPKAILEAAAQTERAKLENKGKSPEKDAPDKPLTPYSDADSPYATTPSSNTLSFAIRAAENVHGFCYDNVNISTSIFVEQRDAGTPAKVQSGTFGLVYILRNAVAEHMLLHGS
ncbi:hypothetical protein B0H14DRAFT_2645286 [Mycena olivaceomarginata]|nr:hypothetical protein B0H14DRAFT_2645286 [Mycena olivaceomarginata]